jgi:hypothetical protein
VITIGYPLSRRYRAAVTVTMIANLVFKSRKGLGNLMAEILELKTRGDVLAV